VSRSRGNESRPDLLERGDWPEGSRWIGRRERPHPGGQLSFTDHDGHRFPVFLTDQSDPDIPVLECRHRQRASAQDEIRADKDTGLRNLPFRDYDMNAVWLELVLIAHDILRWTQALLLTGELARPEPKRSRYRLLHAAARLAFSGRRAELRLRASWSWASDPAHAYAKLKALPAPAG
jgi:hypothetical protein